jgi:hypothetical protein
MKLLTLCPTNLNLYSCSYLFQKRDNKNNNNSDLYLQFKAIKKLLNQVGFDHTHTCICLRAEDSNQLIVLSGNEHSNVS